MNRLRWYAWYLDSPDWLDHIKWKWHWTISTSGDVPYTIVVVLEEDIGDSGE